MNSRAWWVEIPSYNTLFNLNWQPTSNYVKYCDAIQTNCIHSEEHKELSSKINVLNNLQKYCEENQRFFFDILPITSEKFQDSWNAFKWKLQSTNPKFFGYRPKKIHAKISRKKKKHYLYSTLEGLPSILMKCEKYEFDNYKVSESNGFQKKRSLRLGTLRWWFQWKILKNRFKIRKKWRKILWKYWEMEALKKETKSRFKK